ncbi:MAG: hypothetical protein K1X71_07735 [Pirellulales bacterium]|nr:hypothetical protein [Pirellulales bacterium]
MKQAKKPSSTAITRLPGGRWHWTLLAVSIFLAMVVWRWQTLTWPPFDDNAVGLWSEANWLAENQFNYLRLRYEVPHMLEQPGSARSYMISVQPTLLALAIRLLPSVGAVVVAQHLLALFYTAMIALLVYALLCDLVDRLVAALAALVVVTCPLLAAQTDLGGMDLPMAAAALGAALCVKRGRPRWAIAWSAVAFLFKATAIVVGAALVIWLAVAALAEQRRGGKWLSAPTRNALLAIVILALQLALMKWASDVPIPWSLTNSPFLRITILPWTNPDLLALLVAVAAVVGWVWARGRGATTLSSSSVNLLAFTALTLLLLIVALTVAIYVPRYLVLAVPLVWLVLILALHGLGVTTRWLRVVLLAALAINLVNSHGALYPKLPWRYPFLWERSREYQRLAGAWRDAVALLEAKYHDELIFYDWPANFYFDPRYGYLQERLPNAYHITDRPFDTTSFDRLVRRYRNEHQTAGPLFVYANNRPYGGPLTPPPDANSQQLYGDGLPSPLVVYRQPWNDTAPSHALGVWYFHALRDIEPRGSLSLARLLASAGQWDAGIEQAQREVTNNPDDRGARRTLAALQLLHGWHDQALATITAAPPAAPASVDAQLAGEALWGLKREAEAARQWKQAVELDGRNTEARLKLAEWQLRNERPALALAQLQAARAMEPRNHDVSPLLAVALADTGRPCEAIPILEAHLHERPDDLRSAITLARLWATSTDAGCRDPQKAVALAEQLCQQTMRRSPACWEVLSIASQAAGQREAALAAIDEAITICDSKADPALAERLRQQRASLADSAGD